MATRAKPAPARAAGSRRSGSKKPSVPAGAVRQVPAGAGLQRGRRPRASPDARFSHNSEVRGRVDPGGARPSGSPTQMKPSVCRSSCCAARSGSRRVRRAHVSPPRRKASAPASSAPASSRPCSHAQRPSRLARLAAVRGRPAPATRRRGRRFRPRRWPPAAAPAAPLTAERGKHRPLDVAERAAQNRHRIDHRQRAAVEGFDRAATQHVDQVGVRREAHARTVAQSAAGEGMRRALTALALVLVAAATARRGTSSRRRSTPGRTFRC